MSERPMNGPGDLPEDIWAYILSLLKTKDLITSASLVCRLWKRLVFEATSQVFTLQPHVCCPIQADREERESILAKDVTQTLSAYKNRLRVLAICTDVRLSKWDRPPTIPRLASIVETCQNLVVLDLSSCGYVHFLSENPVDDELVLQDLPGSLKILRLPHPSRVPSKSYMNLKGIEVLQTSSTGWNWESSARYHQMLSILQIDGNVWLGKVENLSRFQNLIYLRLSLGNDLEAIQQRTVDHFLEVPKLLHLSLKAYIFTCDIRPLRDHAILKRVDFEGSKCSSKAWVNLWKLPQLYLLSMSIDFKWLDGHASPGEFPPLFDTETCGPQILQVSCRHHLTKFNIPDLLRAPALRSISITLSHAFTMTHLPNLHMIPSGGRSCQIQLSSRLFKPELEEKLKSIGFQLEAPGNSEKSAAMWVASYPLIGSSTEGHEAQNCTLNEILGSDTYRILSTNKLIRQYQNFCLDVEHS